MAAADTSPAPTGNIRSVISPGVTPWASFTQQAREHVPELQWPRSNHTYERVLTDAQAWGLYQGTVGPIENYDWWVDPNGNDPARVALLADDLGLPVGEPEDGGVQHTSLPDEFDFFDMLHEALLAPCFGHYYFEWSGEIRDGLWRIADLAPIHPTGIRQIRSDRQGRLQWITQAAGATFDVVGRQLMAGEPPKLGPESLVPFVFWPDATRRWTGRSLLRPIYRNWLCKDVLIRVDVTNHERAGGVPWIETDETFAGTSLEDLQRLASEFKVDEDGGAALPPGAMLRLARAGGTDIVGSIEYHDGQMAKVWQTMVRELGQQSSGSGSRAVAAVQVDLEAMARRAIAEWAVRTLNRWVLARWWWWNFGLRDAPVLRFKGSDLESGTPVVTPPAAGDAGGGGVPPQVAAARKGSPQPVGASAAQPDPLSMAGLRSTVPARELRRALSDVEVAAAVDFAAIDVAYEEAADRLERAFLDEWLPEQLDAIEESIAYTRSGTVRQRLTALDMARIDVPTVGTTDLENELVAVAEQGATEAAAELGAQGLEVDGVTDALRTEVVDHARAVAQMVSEGVQVAASRRAVQLVGSGMSPTEVAADVRSYLEDLGHVWERDQLAGAVQQAQNAGRLHVFSQVEGSTGMTAYASEVLDSSTCEPCRTIDGATFTTMAAARRAYPSGGYRDCRGGPRCRGTVVVVLNEAAPLV